MQLLASLLTLALLFAGNVSATDAPKPEPKKPFFQPVVPQKDDTPPPAPVPGAVPVLSGDVVYVAASDEPFVLFASPPGLVTVTKESGPLKMRGRFLDGTGKVETRHYTAKSIAIVEAVPGKVGRVELIALKVGETDENKAERIILDVNGAQPPPAPEPKPKPPDPKPGPEPKPAPDVVTGPLWLVTVTQSEGRTTDEESVLNDAAYWKSVEKAGHQFRHYDADDAAAVKSGYAKVYESMGSCLLLVKPDGVVVKKLKLPVTTADVAAVLKEVTGK